MANENNSHQIATLTLREASFGPFLWFPWYGELSKYKLLKEAKQYYESLQQILPEHTDLLSNSILEFVKRRIPDVTVRTGDKIIVNQVHRHFLGDEFDHAHDSEVRFAFLKIIRSNGRSIQISKPICFNGSISILTWGVTNRDYFGRICNRICQHFGIKSLSAIDWVETDDGGHPRAAALIAYDLVGSIRELKKLADSEDHSDPLISTAAMGWSAANKAVYMGYLWAKYTMPYQRVPKNLQQTDSFGVLRRRPHDVSARAGLGRAQKRRSEFHSGEFNALAS